MPNYGPRAPNVDESSHCVDEAEPGPRMIGHEAQFSLPASTGGMKFVSAGGPPRLAASVSGQGPRLPPVGIRAPKSPRRNGAGTVPVEISCCDQAVTFGAGNGGCPFDDDDVLRSCGPPKKTFPSLAMASAHPPRRFFAAAEAPPRRPGPPSSTLASGGLLRILAVSRRTPSGDACSSSAT